MKTIVCIFTCLLWGIFSFAQTGSWVVYDVSNSDLPSDKIESLSFNGSGTWAGTYDGGVAWFDGTNWTTIISGQHVTDMDIDSNGDLWLSTYTNGVYYLEPDETELAGDENSANDDHTVSVTNTPPAPALTDAAQNGYDIDLTWDAWGGSGSIDNFIVYRDGGEVGTAGAGATGYSDDDDYTGGVTYEYYITAVKGSLESGHSDTLSVTYQLYYCEPAFDDPMPRDHYIDSVGFVGIHNYYTGLTGSGDNYYNDYTDTHSTELIRGNTYTLEVYYKQESGAGNTDEYGVWFDWDADGSYTGVADSAFTGSLNMNGDSTLLSPHSRCSIKCSYCPNPLANYEYRCKRNAR